MALVCVYRKEAELPVVVDRKLLCKDKNQAPQVADQPCVNAVVSFVGCHEDLGHDRDQPFQRVLLKVGQQLVLVDVEHLQAAQAGVLFDHLVADVHGFVVSVTNASLDVLQVKRLPPFQEPVSWRVVLHN